MGWPMSPTAIDFNVLSPGSFSLSFPSPEIMPIPFQYSATTTSLMEPESAVDYEQYIQDNLNNITADPLNELLLFPDDDVEVTTVKKQYRTVDVPVPGAAR